MRMMRVSGDEVEIGGTGGNDQAFEAPLPPHPPKKKPVGEVVVKDFDKPKMLKTSVRHSQSFNEAQPLHISLELPTKKSRERVMMRQISGLGMEDPVYGLSNHSMVRAAGKTLPNLYDDMRLSDVPVDMRDMISVCSDPTASLHKDRDLHKAIQRQKSSRIGKMLTTTKKDLKVTQHSRSLLQQKYAVLHPFVPPKSILELTNEQEDSPKKNKKKKASMGDMPEKPSDRRWKKSVIAERLTQLKEEEEQPVQVIIPSFPSKKKTKGLKERFHHSETNLNWDHKKKDDLDDDQELPFEELFTAGKVPVQRRNTHINRSKLSASDSDLFMNSSAGKSKDPVTGLLVEVTGRKSFTRTVSGLTTDNSHYSIEDPAVLATTQKEEEQLDLSNNLLPERSLHLSELQNAALRDMEEAEAESSSHLSYSITEVELLHDNHQQQSNVVKGSKKDASKHKSSSRDHLDVKGHESRKSRDRSRGRLKQKTMELSKEDSNTRLLKPKSMELSKEDSNARLMMKQKTGELTKEDSNARLTRQAHERAERGKNRNPRSRSADLDPRNPMGRESHRRTTRKNALKKLGSQDTAQRMMAFGNTSLKAAERANEIRTNFQRYKKSSSSGRLSKSGGATSNSRASSKRFSNFHTSLTDEKANGMEAVGHKSCGDLDFTLGMQQMQHR